jgi:hypothetical protein
MLKKPLKISFIRDFRVFGGFLEITPSILNKFKQNQFYSIAKSPLFNSIAKSPKSIKSMIRYKRWRLMSFWARFRYIGYWDIPHLTQKIAGTTLRTSHRFDAISFSTFLPICAHCNFRPPPRGSHIGSGCSLHVVEKIPGIMCQKRGNIQQIFATIRAAEINNPKSR